MIHEMRVYHCVPGKLPALLKRFETITLKIWERFGIRQAGFWTAATGASSHTPIYRLTWESKAERKEKRTAFLNDFEWQAVLSLLTPLLQSMIIATQAARLGKKIVKV